MSQEVVAPSSLNHVAYPTWDSGATYRFYTEVLGCRFLAAIREERVPSTGEQQPFLHTFYGFTSGECIAFFEVDGLAPPKPDGIPSCGSGTWPSTWTRWRPWRRGRRG